MIKVFKKNVAPPPTHSLVYLEIDFQEQIGYYFQERIGYYYTG